MSNNAQDYENNLVFLPQDIKSQDDLNKQGRESDVIVTAIEKCERLEKQLKIAVNALKEYGNRVNWDKDGVSFGKYTKGWILANKALAKIKDIN